jgi:hypothetical protein
VIDQPCSDVSQMSADFLIGLLACAFFSAALVFWILAWWRYDRPVSLVAVRFCTILAAAGAITLVVWRIADV